jgi:hypothetical protein
MDDIQVETVCLGKMNRVNGLVSTKLDGIMRAVVTQVAEALDYSLVVESRLSTGTRVSVQVPRYAPGVLPSS